MSNPSPVDESSSNYQLIFDNALETYKKKTGKDPRSDPLLVRLESCNSPDAVIDILQEQIPTLSQSESRRFTKWMIPTVNVLYTFSSTIGSAISLTYPPAGVIFTGIGILLSAAQAVNASQGVLVDLFERIENFFRRLEAYIELPPTVGMTDIIVKVMVEVLLILALATREIKRGRIKKFLKKLAGRSDIVDALRRLDKLTQDEVRMAVAQDLRATHGVADGVRTVGNNVYEMDERVKGVDNRVKGVDDKIDVVIDDGEKLRGGLHQLANDIGDQKRNQLRQDLEKWLSPSDPSVNYNTANDARQEGTALWFTQSSAFKSWKESSGLLWIYGKPGCGKSVLTSAIIKDVNAVSNAGSGHLAFFFFDFKDTTKQDARALLSSLIVQLSNHSNHFYDILLGFYSTHQDGTQQPSVAALTRCLEDMLKVPGEIPIYVIVDALDECPNTTGMPPLRKQVLTLVERLVELNAPNLHLCVTSRPEIDIRTCLEPLTSISNRISLHDETGQRDDINEFVKVVVYSDDNMRRWRDKDKQLVIETLLNRADGMFRWVFCQLQILCQCLPQSVRSILAELPETLDETYERILHQIPKSNRVYAHRLLQCLTVAVRPLKVEELAEVLAMEFTETGGVPILDEDLRWEDQEQAVLFACSSLITIIEDTDSRVVQFAHFSVKEFLTSDRLATSKADASRYYHISLDAAHTIMAQACLAILLRLNDRMDREIVKGYPLAKYAADHFGDHAESEDAISQISGEVDRLLDASQPHFVLWLWMRGTLPWGELLRAVPLYYVAGWGFQSLVQHLISRRPRDVLAMNGEHDTPLHAAAYNGHIKVVQLLLGHCVDVDIQNIYGHTPLHLAAYLGHLEITQMLIGCNANIHAQDNYGQTPLFRVLDLLGEPHSDNYFDVVRVLLEHGADPNVQDKHSSNPLQLASYNRCFKEVGLLLEHGANPNVRDEDGQTLMHKAFDEAPRPCHDVVRLLLKHGGDVNARNNAESTPLHLSLYHGLSETTETLLDHGADVHVRDNIGQTPLHIASKRHDLEMMVSLLDRGADMNAQDDDGSTPLHLASSEGDFESAKLLLDHGASTHTQNNEGQTPLYGVFGHLEPNFRLMGLLLEHGADGCIRHKDHDGQTPLHVAVGTTHGQRLNSYFKAIQLLLSHDAVVDAQDKDQWTPLQLASRHGNFEAAQLLLEHRANVHMSNNGKTSLHLVLEGGSQFWVNSLDLTRILLNHGADVNAQDDDQSTPLYLASCKGLTEVAELLLERGANVDLRHKGGRTSLHCASQHNHLDIVRLLLKYGADVGVLDHTDSTPLHLAAYGGALDATRLLLEHGASVHARDMKGGTPLHDATWGGYVEVMELLVEHGADLDAQSNNGWLPLHLAAYNEDLDAVELLLERGANVHLQEDTGERLCRQEERRSQGCYQNIDQMISDKTI